MSDAMYLVCDMINDLVHEDGPNGKKGYGPILARRKTIANTATAVRKARAAGDCVVRSADQRESKRRRYGANAVAAAATHRDPHQLRVFLCDRDLVGAKTSSRGAAFVTAITHVPGAIMMVLAALDAHHHG